MWLELNHMWTPLLCLFHYSLQYTVSRTLLQRLPRTYILLHRWGGDEVLLVLHRLWVLLRKRRWEVRTRREGGAASGGRSEDRAAGGDGGTEGVKNHWRWHRSQEQSGEVLLLINLCTTSKHCLRQSFSSQGDTWVILPISALGIFKYTERYCNTTLLWHATSSTDKLLSLPPPSVTPLFLSLFQGSSACCLTQSHHCKTARKDGRAVGGG